MNTLQSRLLLLASLCAAPLDAALAEPTFTATVSGWIALKNGPLVEADRVVVPVTQQSGASGAEASGQAHRFLSYSTLDTDNFGYTEAYAKGYASAAPGLLHVFGGARSVATDYFHTPSNNYSSSGYNVSSGINVAASFTDTVTIGGRDGRSFGDVVQIPINYLAEMVSNYPLGYPPYSAHALSAYANFTVPGLAPQSFSTETGFFPWTVTRLSDTTSLYRVRSDPVYVDVHIGDVFAIGATFGVNGLANITDVNRQIEVGGYVDGRNTAAVWLGALPSGVFVTSASGYDYSLDPTLAGAAVPVPEPATSTLLFAGLLATACARRRRRRRAA